LKLALIGSNGRLLTSAIRFFGVMALVISLGWATPARCLDLFTLWRQPEIPLQITEGGWVDYRTQVMAGGRREVSLTRVACLGLADGTNEKTYLLELLPLEENKDGGISPVPGQGAQVWVSRDILNQQGMLLDAVVSVRHWQDGRGQEISPEELREDPLISTSFTSDFVPDEVLSKQSTTRVVAGLQFTCRQWILSSADTMSVVMPAGRMKQISTREIAAAVHEDIPFLGLAYASERIRSTSTLDPPNRKIPLPPARIRVEVMELVDFGWDAKPHLPGSD
jgi:hypothetical protein